MLFFSSRMLEGCLEMLNIRAVDVAFLGLLCSG